MQVSTVLEIKNLSAEGYYSVAGCRGLQLRVTKCGKEFYYRYTWQGKRVLLKIGNMKSVSLSDAKKRTFELAELVAKGINPKEKKNYNEQDNSARAKPKIFKECALEWVKERATNNFWKNNAKGESDTLSRLVNHAFPVIGQIEIENIQPEHIRDLLLPIWGRSPSTSSKVLADVRAILRWTIALRLRENRENPADLNGALGVLMEPYSKNRKTQDNHSSLDFHEIPAFVKDIKALRSRTSEMLLFSILLAARSKAVRNAKWEDIDIENKIWHIPPEDDKVKDEKRSRHIYLNDAAVSLLKEVIRFPESPYVFCSPHGGTYTDMAMNQVIRKAHARKKIVDGIGWIDKEKTKRMGKECIATQHGTARSCFQTWAKDDVLGNNKTFDQDAVDLNLLHERNDPYKGAYDRSKMEQERRKIMEEWGKYCLSLVQH